MQKRKIKGEKKSITVINKEILFLKNPIRFFTYNKISIPIKGNQQYGISGRQKNRFTLR